MEKHKLFGNLFLQKKIVAPILILLFFFLPAANQNALASPDMTIQPNAEYAGSIENEHDEDNYLLSVSVPSSIQIEFKHEIPQDFAGWDVTVLNAKNETLTTLFSDTDDVYMLSDKVRVPAGTYKIKIERAANWNDIGYTFTAFVKNESADNYEKESNNTRTTALKITMGKEYTGNIQDAHDADYYSFSLPSQTDIQIRFQHEIPEDPAAWEIYIYDAKNEEAAEFYSYTEDADISSDPVSLPAGQYYIKVDRGPSWDDIDYMLTVQNAGSTVGTPSESAPEKSASPAKTANPASPSATDTPPDVSASPSEPVILPQTPETIVYQNFEPYNFLNSRDSFLKNYGISESYMSMLKSGMGYSVKKLIDNMAGKSWNGSCIGMSASLIALNTGIISPGYWQQGTNNITDLQQPNINANMNDVVNFYQLMQCLPDNIERTYFSNDQEAFKFLVNETKKITEGGSPVLINFTLRVKGTNELNAHSIVAYGILENDSVYHILIADPSKKITAFNVAKDFSSYAIENDAVLNYDILHIQNIISDPSQISLINPQTGASNVSKYHFSNPLLIAQVIFSFQVSDEAGQSAIVQKDGINGNLPLDRILLPGITSEGDTAGADAFYILPEQEAYTVRYSSPADTALSMNYDDTMEEVKASAAESVQFDPSGSVTMESEEGKPFEISLTADQPSAGMQWETVTVSGNASETVTIKNVGDGIMIEGPGMTGVTVTGTLDGQMAAVSVPYVEDNFLIKANPLTGNGLTAFFDENNDGTFEKAVQSVQQVAGSGMVSTGVHPALIIIPCIVIMLAVPACILLVTHNKRKKRHS